MSPFDLYGTVTSPFVRRVRVVALELGAPCTLVDTNTPEGQARLRALSPVWKVPTARFADGLVAWDSRVIIDVVTRAGWGPMRAPPTDPRGRVDEENVVNAIDEAVLALIRRFYLTKDGFPVDAAPHKKDLARAENLLGWLASRVRDGRYVGSVAGGQGFGRAEIALFTSLDWVRFRKMANLDRWPGLGRFMTAWAERPSLVQTRPG